jgi:hypothetical protein
MLSVLANIGKGEFKQRQLEKFTCLIETGFRKGNLPPFRPSTIQWSPARTIMEECTNKKINSELLLRKQMFCEKSPYRPYPCPLSLINEEKEDRIINKEAYIVSLLSYTSKNLDTFLKEVTNGWLKSHRFPF